MQSLPARRCDDQPMHAAWGEIDIVVVPGWMAYSLAARGDWVVFSFSDRAAQEKLGFFREQRL